MLPDERRRSQADEEVELLPRPTEPNPNPDPNAKLGGVWEIDGEEDVGEVLPGPPGGPVAAATLGDSSVLGN